MREYFILMLENRFPCVIDVESRTMIHQPHYDGTREDPEEIKTFTIDNFSRWVARNYPGQNFEDDYALVDTPPDVCQICCKFELNETEIDQSQRIFDYTTCGRCFEVYVRWCEYCDDGYHVHQTRNARGREGERVAVCRDCFEEHIYQCVHCGSASTGNNCHRCDQGVTFYSAKPTFEPIGQGPIWYGIELEVEVKGGEPDPEYGERSPEVDRVAQLTRPQFPKDYCILKEDGSLNGGFEICTRPASVEYHKEAFKDFFKNPYPKLRSWEGGNCGIHVHISRRPLSQLQIGKMLVLIHDFTEFTQRIAQRISPYGDYSAKKKITDARYHGEARDGQARHEALNLVNDETVELRIFRGSLNPVTFWKCIEFTEALVHFTSTGQFGINEIRPETFIKFALRREKQWPNLASFLRKPFTPPKPIKQRENNTYRPLQYRDSVRGQLSEDFIYTSPRWTTQPDRNRQMDEDVCRDRNCRECYPENPIEIEAPFDEEMARSRAQRVVDQMIGDAIGQAEPPAQPRYRVNRVGDMWTLEDDDAEMEREWAAMEAILNDEEEEERSA